MFKQVVGGLGKPLGKSPAPDRIQSPRDLDRSFPCWPGSGYFGAAPRGCAVHSWGATPLPTGDPRPPHPSPKYGGEEHAHSQATTGGTSSAVAPSITFDRRAAARSTRGASTASSRAGRSVSIPAGSSYCTGWRVSQRCQAGPCLGSGIAEYSVRRRKSPNWLGAEGGVHWTNAPGPAGPASSTAGRRPRRGTGGGDSCSMGSSPHRPAPPRPPPPPPGGGPSRLGGSGTRAAAVRGTAASSSADRVAALDAREADADPAVDLDPRGGRRRLSRLTPRRRGLPARGRAVRLARPTGCLPPAPPPRPRHLTWWCRPA